MAQFARFEQFDQQSQKQVLCQCNSMPQSAPFRKKQTHPFQNWIVQAQIEVYSTTRLIKSFELWAWVPSKKKRKQKGYLLLVTRVLSAMEILKGDFFVHGGSKESEGTFFFSSGLKLKGQRSVQRVWLSCKQYLIGELETQRLEGWVWVYLRIIKIRAIS